VARVAERRTKERTLAVVVLAAGKGERLRSSTPKVLHPICGRPALWHALRAVRGARPDRLVVVVGHGADRVREAIGSWGVVPPPRFVVQAELLGTGHAVLAAERAVGRVDDVLVVGGDYDPVTDADVRALLRLHRRSGAAATIATADLDRPGAYGRVVREGERLVRIVEHADATAAERRIREVALLVAVFRREDLYRALPLVGRDNRQREHYLTDVVPILLDKGERVSALPVDTGGAMGLNARGGLAALTRVVRRRIVDRHLKAGVTIVDPDATYIDVDVRIGRDSVIGPMTFLEGSTRIGPGCRIGPGARVRDAVVGEGSAIEFAVVEGARIGRRVQVGPFARVRPGTRLADDVVVGSFVEVKNSSIGAGSKVPHLSYVGDATVGRRTNIGAANVTANWDGYEKHRTVIGDDVRTGSDTIMVAPVRIGSGAVTGAGSVITKDVPAGALAIERAEQRVVRGYRARKDAARSKDRR
jgi:bifunctional UDP-N-acetylglucosamine pyrophosphorylase/glucosamine-1-phosphate N-acetyltransferase